MSRDQIDVMNLLAGKRVSPANDIQISRILPPEWQPRQKFEEEKLKELANSILKNGLLQPLIVEPLGEKYRLVAGERRYRALQMLNWEFVPVRIVEGLDDKRRIHIQIAENLQREDITPIERSRALKKLFEANNLSIDEAINTMILAQRDPARLNSQIVLTVNTICEMLGKSKATILNWLRLLKLPEEVQNMLDDPNGPLTPKHAGEILKLDDIKRQIEIAHLIEKMDLSVSETKELVETKKGENQPGASYKSLFNTSKKMFAHLEGFDFKSVDQSKLQDIVKELEKLNDFIFVLLKKYKDSI